MKKIELRQVRQIVMKREVARKLQMWGIITILWIRAKKKLMEIKISDELNNIIRYAREEAMRTGSYGIGPDHLFLGMMRQGDNEACKVLINMGVDIDEWH